MILVLITLQATLLANTNFGCRLTQIKSLTCSPIAFVSMSVLKEVFCACVIYLYIASSFIKAEFSVVSKIWRAINSPKYKGINENYIYVITEW